ncbi:hypothetical protein QYE76_061501 [Lolium multiflorum]|uniref:Uncharacterized protein n=1 Tax=Lolium multiflorum TaxID=4521 RepID=A0AAD8W4S1_LOLMU|nr:hypothetical protein QYE76_061501 [Lolium multiflorum]
MDVGGERHGWGRNSSDSDDRRGGGDELCIQALERILQDHPLDYDSHIEVSKTKDFGSFLGIFKYGLYYHGATDLFILPVQSIPQKPKDMPHVVSKGRIITGRSSSFEAKIYSMLGFIAGHSIGTITVAYTNRTMLPQALEKKSLDIMQKLLSRHVEIIETIDEEDTYAH